LKVIRPEQAERRNIITKRELQVMADALDYYYESAFIGPARGKLIREARRKLQRTLEKFSTPRRPEQ